MKVKKRFEYNGVTLQIVERPEQYMNATEPLMMTRVIAPNGGSIPVSIGHRDTLKAIITKTIASLDGFAARGANVIETLINPIKIEPCE
jgi:hypothetical protein